MLLIGFPLQDAVAAPWQDTTTAPVADTLKYPIFDRRGDFISSPQRGGIDLRKPSNIKDSIVYDPETRQYYILEKIGSFYYRKPTYLSFEEFLNIQSRKSENEYFRTRADILSNLNRSLLRPELKVRENMFDRIFGNGKVEIRPMGDVNIIAGYQGQNIKNPALPERARRNGGFDFDMNANLSVIGNIGDKLKLPINYNTQSTFDFENQLRLEYTGGEDEIIKRIEAGNVSFSSKGSLIPGAQSLFGVKTQLQFGKLFVTGVIANQKAQRQSMGLQGSAATQDFEFKANDYEENRHFLLSQYFVHNYNNAMSNLPVVNSQVQIIRLEVWVTNRNGSTTQTRDIVGLMDLGEANPFNTAITANLGNPLSLPYNDANDLFSRIATDPAARNSSQVTTRLMSLGLRPVQDFEKTFARKLNEFDYYFNPQIGFLSLNQPLQPDEVLAVAFQYSYNGRIFQVGEFSQEVSPDTTGIQGGTQKILFLKLLKATSQRTNLPIWDLMMKNVYSLKSKDGSYVTSIQPGDFELNVLYEEPSLGKKRFLPEGPKQGVPLISVLNLDRLNSRNDPMPDGVFDYIEGFTVISNQARIIFPVLEPFGRALDSLAFDGSPQDLKDRYVYYPLYDTIKEIAKTYANLDRYIISGRAKGQSASEISLNAFNVPQGSVTVTAGGQMLTENVDYIIDYNLGSVRIINEGILRSGVPVNVQYENNAGFGIQQRNFLGLRLDFLAKNSARESLSLGASLVRLSERPYFTKTLYNEDPIRNTMYGLDFNYYTEAPRITRLLNRLPFYTTNEMSTVTAYGEGAFLKPGHPPQIGKNESGMVFIDDFEGSKNSIDLRFPLVSWGLSSTPAGNGLFPEAELSNDLAYGYNRAKIAWYNIEPVLQDRRNTNNPVRAYEDFTDPRIRQVKITEIYPNRTPDFGQAQLVTFDLAFYPREKGPYNYDARPGSVTADNRLLNPSSRWGGIMRGLDQVDFETGNVEFIEFWLQDPFLRDPGSSGGQLYFNLGNISEDVLKDGKRFFENGLSGAATTAIEDTGTVWGKVPANPLQVTAAFSNDPADRPFQDAGLDGLTNEREVEKFQDYLNELAATYGVNSQIYQDALNDPSNDDFLNYRNTRYDQSQTGILGRYKNINNPQGNSPVAASGDEFVSAFTLYPDQEEFNRDNTLNELEEYFEYRIDLTPSQLGTVGQNYITDVRTFTPSGGEQEQWYLFRIPIDEFEQKVGNIPDFKSIRFIRMYMTGFEDSVILRFAKLELVRNTWRRFNYELDTMGVYTSLPVNSPTTVNQLAVNIEENSSRRPVPYKTPPNVLRQEQLSNNNVNLLLNEQSLSLQICELQRGDVRGVFKTMNLDLRQYGELKMYTHIESAGLTDDLRDNDLYSVVRIGNDLVNNYYEIRIPLRKTPWGSTAETDIWPDNNNLDMALEKLISLKLERNNNGLVSQYYKKTEADGREYAILGNPNLGEVRIFFIGIENRNSNNACLEVWFNELSLGKLNESGGWAALGRVDIKLADLGTLYVSGSARSTGFGALEQRINERSRENFQQFDVATNLELGKLLPESAGISIPVYASVSKIIAAPEYDPYDLDIKLKDKLENAPVHQKDSIRTEAVEARTIKTVNFTNVKKNNIAGKKQRIYSIENFDISYSYYKEEHINPLIEKNEVTRHRAGLGYNYSGTPNYWEPLRPAIKSGSPWLAMLRDFNLNPVPSLISFRADVFRQFGAFRPRNVGGPKGVLPETYDKYFTFDRVYNLRWDLSRSINVDFSATNKSWIDEDTGRLDGDEKKRMWDNFWKGGRTISYQQTAGITYELPTSKLPLIDWTSVRVGYTGTYNWAAASLLARSLGNTLSNGQQKTATAEFDFGRLYAKSRWLRALDQPPGQQQARPKQEIPDSLSRQQKRAMRQNQPVEMNGAVRFLGGLLTSLKRVSVNYSENANSAIYGYTDSTRILGMNFRSMAPGLDYVFGWQPDTSFISHLANKGLITPDPAFNFQNRQDYNQRLSLNAQLIPIRDLTVDVSLDKTFGKSYTELYKDTLGFSGEFARLNPYTMGSFSISYISFQTLFEKQHINDVSEAFLKFQDNRIVLSERLARQNPYWEALPDTEKFLPDGFYNGYGRYAQDVLLPAFLAAYTNKDPGSISLIKQSNPGIRSNPFAGILPKPNWRVTYTGLSRLPLFEKIFSNFTISHGYTGTLSMNSFNSDLLFRDPFALSYPGFIDTLTGNFIPYFLVPNISIMEQFAPLIDIDMQFTNQFTTRFEYRKSRQLSLSLVDYQLSESRSTEFTIGAGFRKRGAFSFIKWKGKPLENDAAFRLDFSIRDDATSNSRLDQDQVLPTSGQKVILISPTLDYVVSNRVNIRLYFEQRRVEPKISTSPPITNTRAGVQIRLSLAQ